MHIRRLSPSDADGLLAFYLSLSEETVRLFRPFDLTEEVICAHLAEADAGKHISLGLVGPDGDIEGHSFILSVDGEKPVFGIGLRERAVGRGWGHRLMEAVLAEADSLDLPLVTLTVIKDNHRASALYEKMGVEIREGVAFPGSENSYWMERKRPGEAADR